MIKMNGSKNLAQFSKGVESFIGVKIEEFTPTELSKFFNLMSDKIEKLYNQAYRLLRKMQKMGYNVNLRLFKVYTFRPSPDQLETMLSDEVKEYYQTMEAELIALIDTIDVLRQYVNV